MKMLSKSFVYVGLVWMGAARLLAVTPGVPTVPYEPAELLGVLPETPKDWTLVRSEADTNLAEWLSATATRVFQAPVGTGADSGLTPGEVEINVVDTAGFAAALADFAEFTPGKIAGLERKLIGTLPTIVFPAESGRQITQVLVASRYIVSITLTRLPKQHAEDWLRGFHFDRLTPHAEVASAPAGRIRLTHVDELHPEGSRSYFVTTGDSKKLEALLKTLPKEETGAGDLAKP